MINMENEQGAEAPYTIESIKRQLTQAVALLATRRESKVGSRQESIVMTKLQEAQMWLDNATSEPSQ